MTETYQKPRVKQEKSYSLRFYDEALRRQVRIRAAQNDRTLNSEILFLIKRGIVADAQQMQGVTQ